MSARPFRSTLINSVRGVLALFVGNAAAATYTFINIADAGREGPFLDVGVPSINDSGTVAFDGFLHAGGTGIFTSRGRAITTLYDTGGPFRNLLQYCCVSINNSDTVAFSADLDTGGEGIFTGGGGPTTTISDNRTHFSPTDFNDSGTVAFRLGGGIFMGSGGPITTIASINSGPFATITLSPSLNDSGTVAFGASLDTGGEGIFTGSGGPITTIADSSGPFDSFIPAGTSDFFPPFITLNDAGTVAFAATLDAGGEGIFTSSDGLITTIVDSSGPFRAFSEPLINDSGMVAFLAADTQGFGLFIVGPDTVAHSVIRLGDPLFGSTLTRLIIAPDSLNDSGQIAFAYVLDGGPDGIALASPRAILEPGTLALLGLGLLGLGLTRLKAS